MSDFDDRARHAAERVRRSASEIATRPPSLSDRPVRIEATPRRPRYALAIGLAALLVGLGAVAGWWWRGLNTDGELASSDTTAVETTTTAVPSTTSTALATTTTTTTSTSTSTPLPETPVGITRPGTDPAVCEPYSARGWSTSTFDMTLFAMPEAPLPVQIIGRPGSGPADPFALLIRYHEFQLPVHGVHLVEVGDTTVHIRVNPNGNGEARWALPDGTYGYLRSRGLDQEELESIVVRLSPRDVAEPIPGFDVAPPTDDRFDFMVLHEQLNVDVSASGATLDCTSPINGFDYRISAVAGDPLFIYGAVIDRPIPLDVGIRDGTLIIISGPEYPGAHPAVGGVVNLDEETWAELLTQPTSTDRMQGAAGMSSSDG